MDDRSFDRLARALGGASSRRAALGALLGIGVAAAPTVGKRRNRKRCKPECTGNLSCVDRQCVCRSIVCGAACCATGQICQRGRCVGTAEVCHDLAEACGDGTPCCAGLVCGSGFGGGPVACWAEPGGECIANEECPYGSRCVDGACRIDPPPTPAPTPTPTPAAPNCTVCASGCPHSTIEGAIAAATAGGETITVAGGTYAPVAMPPEANYVQSYLVITRPLTLKACVPGQAVTVVCPAGNGRPDHCITAYGPAAQVTIEGIEVEHSDPPDPNREERGFASWNGAALTLRDVAARRFSTGVFAESYSIGTWPDATVTTAGLISITGTGTGNQSDPLTYGVLSNNQSHITVSGDVSIAKVKTGLDFGSGTLSCTAPISYTTTQVVYKCSTSFPGCPCS